MPTEHCKHFNWPILATDRHLIILILKRDKFREFDEFSAFCVIFFTLPAFWLSFDKKLNRVKHQLKTETRWKLHGECPLCSPDRGANKFQKRNSRSIYLYWCQRNVVSTSTDLFMATGWHLHSLKSKTHTVGDMMCVNLVSLHSWGVFTSPF